MWQLYWDPRDDDCPDCPRNLLLVDGDRACSTWSTSSLLSSPSPCWASWRFCWCNVCGGRVEPARRAPRPGLSCWPPWRSSRSWSLPSRQASERGRSRESRDGLGGRLARCRSPSWSVCCVPGCTAPRSPISSSSWLAAVTAQVRDAIARTLRDESLQLAFWLPDRGRYVGPDGAELDPDGQPGRAVTIWSATAGASPRSSTTRHSSTTPPSSTRSARRRAWRWRTPACRPSCAPSSTRCAPRVSASSKPATPSVDALERDLHDGAQQRLLGIRLALQLVRGRLADAAPRSTSSSPKPTPKCVGALDELRALARGIHPALLTDEGLAAALAALARRVPVPVELAVCTERLPATWRRPPTSSPAKRSPTSSSTPTPPGQRSTISRANGHVAIDDDRRRSRRGRRRRRRAPRAARPRRGTRRAPAVDSVPGHGTRVTAAIPCG